jgi:hypothetical protein
MKMKYSLFSTTFSANQTAAAECNFAGASTIWNRPKCLLYDSETGLCGREAFVETHLAHSFPVDPSDLPATRTLTERDRLFQSGRFVDASETSATDRAETVVRPVVPPPHSYRTVKSKHQRRKKTMKTRTVLLIARLAMAPALLAQQAAPAPQQPASNVNDIDLKGLTPQQFQELLEKAIQATKEHQAEKATEPAYVYSTTPKPDPLPPCKKAKNPTLRDKIAARVKKTVENTVQTTVESTTANIDRDTVIKTHGKVNPGTTQTAHDVEASASQQQPKPCTPAPTTK